MAWLTGWSYRKKITITGQSGAGTDFQIKLLVGETSGATGENFDVEGKSDSFPTGKNVSGDLRFTASDETTLLPFWVESVSGETPNRLATIWIKVAADLDTNKDIYCYYGGTTTNVSSITGPFIFADDFDDETLDTDKWDKRVELGTITETGGYLQCGGGIKTGDYGHTALDSKSVVNMRTFVVEGGIYLSADAISEFGLRGGSDNTGYKTRGDARSGQGLGVLKPPYATWDFLADGAASGTAIANSTWLTFITKVYDNGTTCTMVAICGAQSNTATDNDYATQEGRISLQNHYGEYARYDDVRVRKYVATEPAYNTAGSEEDSGLSINVSDQLNLTENVAVARDPAINVSDQLNLTENVSVVPEHVISVYDTLTITDKPFYYSNTVLISESVNIEVSSVTEDLDINVSDQLNLTESVSIIPDLAVNTSDQLNLTESVSIVPEHIISVSDQLNLTENVDIEVEAPPVVDLDVSVSDQLNITEDISVSRELIISASDQINLTEDTDIEIEATITPDINVSDGLNLTEDIDINVEAIPDLEISVSDQINLTESVSVIRELVIDILDQLNLTEDTDIDIQAVPTLEIDVYSSLTITEDVDIEVGELPALEINVSDQSNLTEDIDVARELVVSVSDQVNLTESVSVIRELSTSVSDQLNITEDVSVALSDPTINISEQINITESVSVDVSAVTAREISVSDQLDITENIAVAKELVIGISDQLNLTEDIDIARELAILTINVVEELTISESTEFLFPELPISVYDELQITESLTLPNIWSSQRKHTAAWVEDAKNTATWIEDTKNTATWTEDTKNTSDWVEDTKHTAVWEHQ